jgi:hypothetical protein
MSGLKLRVALFCAITFASTAVMAIPYLTLQ